VPSLPSPRPGETSGPTARDDLYQYGQIRRGPPRIGAREHAAAGIINAMARLPDTVKTTLTRRLETHRAARWPQLARLDVRYRGEYAYIDAVTDDVWPLCRLRYTGSASRWGFAIHLASRDGYEESILPSGLPAGTPEEALDCACGLYLGDPTAWIEPPKD
jgi:hypothetical protein